LKIPAKRTNDRNKLAFDFVRLPIHHLFTHPTTHTMKFGFRVPSLKKRLSARLSAKRYIRHNLGFKAPRGAGWLTNPKKALYNRVYNRTTTGCMLVLGLVWAPGLVWLVWRVVAG
jgi:hypothetical protein